jgi:hypothetical protein
MSNSDNQMEEKTINKGDINPTHNMEGEYVILMETSGKECESWYNFIRKKDNEESLEHLNKQLKEVDWYIMGDLSIFDLDLEHTVSAVTAKQMTKIDVNSYMYHRKFDGKLDKIDLGFKRKDSNTRKVERTFDLLGYGQIEDYISDEDLDPEDLTEISESESDYESDSDSESENRYDLKKLPSSIENINITKRNKK